MKRPANREIVWVTWKDAVGGSSRGTEEDIADAALATNLNIGWIKHRTDELIVLAHGDSSTGEYDHFTIPVANVVSIEHIISPRKPSKKLEVSDG